MAKIEIEMVDGSKKNLADLTPADLPNVKLVTGKKKGQDATWFTLKSEVIATDTTHVTERRIYKWATMPALVMYDVRYGKDLDTFAKETGKKETYSYAIGNFLIEQDKLHNGVTTADPAKKVSSAISALEAQGVPKEQIEAIKASLKAKGFFK